MSLIRRKNSGDAWETVVDVGDGAEPIEPISVELTTDPDTFAVESEVYDLGGVMNSVVLSVELVAYDADGETLGHADGEGNIDVGWSFLASMDGVHFGPLPSAITSLYDSSFGPPRVNPADDGFLTTVGDPYAVGAMALRFFKFEVHVDDFDSGDLYTGSNHPTITVLFGLVPLP